MAICVDCGQLLMDELSVDIAVQCNWCVRYERAGGTRLSFGFTDQQYAEWKTRNAAARAVANGH